MKKKLFAVCLLGASLLAAGAACAQETEATPDEAAAQAAVQQTAGDSAQEGHTWENVVLPETFLITYSVVKADGTSDTLTYGVDAEGRRYLAEGGVEKLYVPAEDGFYRLAQTRGETTPVITPAISVTPSVEIPSIEIETPAISAEIPANLLTLASIEAEATEFMTYARGTLLPQLANAVYIETVQFCGREADVYEIERNLNVFKNVARITVDRETGVCLQSADNSQLMGVELGPSVSITCTQFVTADVILPLTDEN